MRRNQHILSTSKLLVSRLERLSADSAWAHRASGLRGSLLRAIQAVEALSADCSSDTQEIHSLERLLEEGFRILSQAAREIRGDENNR